MRKIKIFLCDNPQYKTTRQLKKHWESDDRFELITDPYFHPIKAKWADVTWIEWCEMAMIQASKREGIFRGLYDDFIDPAHKNPIEWSGNWNNTKLINRAIDIDVHFGHYRQVEWQNVDHLIFIAKHIQDIVLNDATVKDKISKINVHHIPLSIDLSEWTYRDKTKTHTKNIAFVHHLWSGKGLPLAIQAFKKVVDLDPEYKLYIVGNWSNERWLPPYIKHIIKELKLENNIVFQGRVPSVDKFLDNMDYVMSSSHKEAFSLIVAEGMAKGLKPLIHNWEGAKDIWDEKYIWTDIDDFVKLVFGEYNSPEYREFVKRYDWVNEYTAIDNLILNL